MARPPGIMRHITKNPPEPPVMCLEITIEPKGAARGSQLLRAYARFLVFTARTGLIG